MKKALMVVAAVGLVVWVASWFRNDKAVAISGAKAWPENLGTLADVARRYPPLQANDAAKKLIALAAALPKNHDVTASRELLLHDAVVWPRDGGVGHIGDKETTSNRVVQMNIARALVARGQWEDLHAAWNLRRSLDAQPQMMTQTAALSIDRMINAAAWKMPLPPPQWFNELQQRDEVPRLLEAFQYQAASYWNDGARVFPTKWLADSAEHDRLVAEALAKETRCAVAAPSNELGVDLATVWRRAFRYRAEREATANALRIREGKPIETRSSCSDGAWTYDGTTLRFSRDIPVVAADRAMPLVLQVSRTRPSPAPK